MPGSGDRKASVPEAVSTTFVQNFNTLIDTQIKLAFCFSCSFIAPTCTLY